MSAEPVFRERLWPGPLGWSFVVGFAAFVFIALLPVHAVAAGAAAILTLAAAVGVAIAWSTVVEVAGGELRVGQAHIPLTYLGEVDVLDRAGVRRRLGPGSDARTFACVRAWIPGGISVQVVDPDDPTPAWLISSRRPSALAGAVRAGAGNGQAHSVQII